MVQTVQMYVFVQFLNKVGDLPVAPVESPQVQFLDVVGHFDRCRGPDSENCLESLYAEADPPGPVCSEIPQFVDTVADVPVMWPCRFSVAAVEKTAAIPQLKLVEKSLSLRRVLLRQGDRRPCCAGGAGFLCRRGGDSRDLTGAAVE